MSMKSSLKPSSFLPVRAKLVRRFRQDDDGATAVEFAIIGIPFFLLVFSIIESAIFFFANQYLETSVDNVARLFRTGQLDNTTTEAAFKQTLCDEIAVMFDCNKILTDVQVAHTFEDLEDPPLPDANGNFDKNDYGYQPPGPVQVLQITATYQWPVITNFAAPLRTSGSSTTAAIHVIAVSRTEPY